jgi:hypothetical protein
MKSIPKMNTTNPASTHICILGRGAGEGSMGFFFLGVISGMKKSY